MSSDSPRSGDDICSHPVTSNCNHQVPPCIFWVEVIVFLTSGMGRSLDNHCNYTGAHNNILGRSLCRARGKPQMTMCSLTISPLIRWAVPHVTRLAAIASSPSLSRVLTTLSWWWVRWEMASSFYLDNARGWWRSRINQGFINKHNFTNQNIVDSFVQIRSCFHVYSAAADQSAILMWRGHQIIQTYQSYNHLGVMLFVLAPAAIIPCPQMNPLSPWWWWPLAARTEVTMIWGHTAPGHPGSPNNPDIPMSHPELRRECEK